MLVWSSLSGVSLEGQPGAISCRSARAELAPGQGGPTPSPSPSNAGTCPLVPGSSASSSKSQLLSLPAWNCQAYHKLPEPEPVPAQGPDVYPTGLSTRAHGAGEGRIGPASPCGPSSPKGRQEEVTPSYCKLSLGLTAPSAQWGDHGKG